MTIGAPERTFDHESGALVVVSEYICAVVLMTQRQRQSVLRLVRGTLAFDFLAAGCVPDLEVSHIV